MFFGDSLPLVRHVSVLCLDLASCLGTQPELLFFKALAVGSALSGLSKIGAHEPGDNPGGVEWQRARHDGPAVRPFAFSSPQPSPILRRNEQYFRHDCFPASIVIALGKATNFSRSTCA